MPAQNANKIPAVDINDPVAVAATVSNILGVAMSNQDYERQAERLVTASDNPGVPYVEAGSAVPLAAMVQAVNKAQYPDSVAYHEIYAHRTTWGEKGTDPQNIGGLLSLPAKAAPKQYESHVRLALVDGEGEAQTLAHFAGLAHNSRHAKKGPTQRNQFLARQAELAQTHPNLDLKVLGGKAMLWLLLHARLTGQELPQGGADLTSLALPLDSAEITMPGRYGGAQFKRREVPAISLFRHGGKTLGQGISLGTATVAPVERFGMGLSLGAAEMK